MGGRLHPQGQLTGSEGKLHFLLGLWGVLPLRRATGSLCLNSRGGRTAGGGGERTAERKEGGREKTRTGQRGREAAGQRYSDRTGRQGPEKTLELPRPCRFSLGSSVCPCCEVCRPGVSTTSDWPTIITIMATGWYEPGH